MSTRRLFLPVGPGPAGEQVWIYGTHGGVGLIVIFPDGTIALMSADWRWAVIPNIYSSYGTGGQAYATNSVAVMPSGATEAQAMALYLKANGRVDSNLLGTFMSDDPQSGFLMGIWVIGGITQYAALPTDLAPAVLGTPTAGKRLLCAGLFTSYLDTTPAAALTGSVAAIDTASGLLDTTFAGLLVTISATYGTVLSPTKLFSDGNSLFGIYGVGVTTNTSYVWSFPAGVPAGAGTLVSIGKIPGGGAITLPCASYGATGFNGPVLLNNDGSIGAAFTCGRFSLARPVPDGAGKFWQDSIVTRQNPDPPTSGTVITQSAVILTSSAVATTFTVGAVGSASIGTLVLPVLVVGEGGSAASSFSGSYATAAALAADVAAKLFPDCSFTFVDSSVAGTRLEADITFTPPSGARYWPSCFAEYELRTGGLMSVNAAIGYNALCKSDGSSPQYFQIPSASSGSFKAVSSALAVNGSALCYVYSFRDSKNNLQWRVIIPGVATINIALNYTLGTIDQGQFTLSPAAGDFLDCPVSVTAMGTGFAVALPYLPIYGFPGTAGAPKQYAVNVAKAGAATILMNGPVILFDASSGAPDTGFDAAFSANFFSLARTDGRRYGPQQIIEDADGNFRFGSFYMPTFIDLAATNPSPTDEFGTLTHPPALSPFAAVGPGLTVNGAFPHQVGPGLEVFCTCDDTGGIVNPV